jgi:photosystem II PsbM protein
VFFYLPIEAGVIMETNDLGFVATILFILVPSVFLIILYIQTASRQGKKD